MAAQRPTTTADGAGKGTDVVPLRARTTAAGARPNPLQTKGPVVFDDASGPGWLAAAWCPDGTVELTVGRPSANSDVEFRLAGEDVLELVRVLVEGLNDSGSIRPGPPAAVLTLPTRPRN